MSPDELSASMKQLGLETQLQMAAAIGVSRSSISLWLDGKVGVPRPVAMLIRMLVAAQRRQF
jgi:transcriptional regulator with XRE-family HTH domain